jgi:small subunit ribosomal protein S20
MSRDRLSRFVATPERAGTCVSGYVEAEGKLANIKSQKKRVLTNAKAAARNKGTRTAVKTAVKKVNEAISAGDKTAAQEQLKSAIRALDKAASTGVIHKNQAANRKSGIAKQVAALKD